MEEDHHKMRPLTQLETKQYYQDMNSMRASNSMNLDDLNKKFKRLWKVWNKDNIVVCEVRELHEAIKLLEDI